MYRPEWLPHTSIYENPFHHFPLLVVMPSIGSIDDQCIFPTLACSGSIHSCRLVLGLFFVYIVAWLSSGRKLIRYHEQTQGCVNGEMFSRPYIFIIYTQLSHKQYTRASSSKPRASSATHLEELDFVTASLDSFSILYIRAKTITRNQLLSTRSLCYQNQINIPGELCFLNREKEQIQSCISLLLITEFICLIKFSLILIQTTCKNLFSKFLFHKPFIIFRSKQIGPVFLHWETNNCRKKLSFFFNKNILSLTTHILLVLHTEMFPLSFLHITIFTPWSLNETDSNIKPALLDWPTQEHIL